jgi:hypothetical protein
VIAVCDMGPLHYPYSQTSFYIGEKAKAVIDGMKQRDSERKLTNEQQARDFG